MIISPIVKIVPPGLWLNMKNSLSFNFYPGPKLVFCFSTLLHHYKSLFLLHKKVIMKQHGLFFAIEKISAHLCSTLGFCALILVAPIPILFFTPRQKTAPPADNQKTGWYEWLEKSGKKRHNLYGDGMKF